VVKSPLAKQRTATRQVNTVHDGIEARLDLIGYIAGNQM
jgi:hypothetical protein